MTEIIVLKNTYLTLNDSKLIDKEKITCVLLCKSKSKTLQRSDLSFSNSCHLTLTFTVSLK